MVMHGYWDKYIHDARLVGCMDEIDHFSVCLDGRKWME
jgi:hypothetical protein